MMGRESDHDTNFKIKLISQVKILYKRRLLSLRFKEVRLSVGPN